ncbi:MAG TPA: UvrB/UvrC motif-containing protein [Pirellulales bacterium]
MARDISGILEGWEFDPDQLSVRIIKGGDGREKIQMRLELGLLQMEMDGRPDGLRPEGLESWLDVYRQRQRAHQEAQPDAAPYQLEAADCQFLLREGIQYYHRYLSFWHLKRYELCARDTNRNLRLFKFVRDYARREQDKRQFDQWRPYVIMMHTRAVATPLVEMSDYEAAAKAIEAGIGGIRLFLEEYQQTEHADQCPELTHLVRWRDELLAQAPPRPVEPPDLVTQLREQLAKAIEDERFEDAARLRDEIRRQQQSPFQGPTDEKL